MKRIIPFVASTLGCLVLVFLVGVAHRTSAATRPPQFDGGAASVDALLDRFLSALQAKDETALHRLRVTEKEYRDIIIPGSAKPDEAPRQATEANSQFFWSMLNAKSEDIARLLIKNYGGQHYTRKELKLSKGTRKFGWYTAHGDVQLILQDESGQTRELHTGTIAEVGGRYKFIGFNGK
jgi:hypothetical protein